MGLIPSWKEAPTLARQFSFFALLDRFMPCSSIYISPRIVSALIEFNARGLAPLGSAFLTPVQLESALCLLMHWRQHVSVRHAGHLYLNSLEWQIWHISLPGRLTASSSSSSALCTDFACEEFSRLESGYRRDRISSLSIFDENKIEIIALWNYIFR